MNTPHKYVTSCATPVIYVWNMTITQVSATHYAYIPTHVIHM